MKNISKHNIIHKFCEGLNRDLANSFLLIGQAGIGKTETVLSSFKKSKMKESEHFKYLNNYSSPLEFYHILSRINKLKKPRLLILDDCEEFINSKRILSILRSALWAGIDGKRIIHWNSTSSKVETDSFEFTGKIIFLVNELNLKNSLIKALISRGFFYHLTVSNREKIELMKTKSKEPYKGLNYKDRQKIVNYLAEIGKDSKKLNLRSLVMAYNLYILSPNHHKTLISEMLI